MTAEERQELKLQALRLKEEGVPVMEIVRRTRLSYGTVSTVLKKGFCVPAKRAGRKAGSGGALTPEQQLAIRLVIGQRSPKSAGVKDSVWNRDAVSRLITKNYGVKLSRRGVDNYLSSWGICINDSNLPPSRRCVVEIQSWCKENKAALAEMVKVDGAVKFWLNRSIELDAASWYGPRSKPLHKKVQFLSAENGKGTIHWNIFPGNLTPEREIKFLDNLRRHIEKKLILIRSRRPIYHRPKVLEYAEQSNGQLVLLPPREMTDPLDATLGKSY